MKSEILNRDFFVQTSVFIPIIKDKLGKNNLVFEVRTEHIRQGNEICFPGGLFEPKIDINFEETAVRETYEELGINKSKIRIERHLGCIVLPYGTIVEVFIGYIDITDLSDFNYSKIEVSKVFSLPLSFFEENKPEEYETFLYMEPYTINAIGIREDIFPAKRLGLPQKYWNRWEGKKNKIYVYKTAYGTIWGITALLALLASKIKLD